ncbi:MAG: FecR family protein [Marinifilaceae bacterium]
MNKNRDNELHDIVELHKVQRSIEFIEHYDSDKYWSRIMKEVRYQKNKRIMFRVSAVAAMVVMSLGVYLFFPKTDVQPELSIANLEYPVIIQSRLDNSVIAIDSVSSALISPVSLAVSTSNKKSQTINKEEIVRYKVVIPTGFTQDVELPDGTKIKLNAGSVLEYASDYNAANREVTFKGEGFFDVVKSEHPFVVMAGISKIQVYGTKFNVYHSDNLAVSETILVEGALGVQMNGNELMVKPNQRVTCNFTEGLSFIQDVDATDCLGWLENNFKYNNETLGRIVADITNWYGVEIECASELNGQRYSMEFARDTRVDWVFKALSKLTETRIIEEGGIYRIVSNK